MLDKLVVIEEKRQKNNFYASDFGKPALDLYFSLINEPKTNPPKWNDTLKFGAGNGVEAQMVKILKDTGITPPDYDQKVHGRIELTHNKIKVTGYIDVKTFDGTPIEVKSVNNKNSQDVQDYKKNKPRKGYCGQLALYQYQTGKDNGILFVSTIDGLSYFWFDQTKIGDGLYQCGEIITDVKAELARFEKIAEMVEKRQMPDIWEKRYKYDIETIDWRSIPKSKITAARTNKAVIGDWEVQYSPWKNKIVELQGTTLGYTEEELARIAELTAGYSAWDKPKK